MKPPTPLEEVEQLADMFELMANTERENTEPGEIVTITVRAAEFDEWRRRLNNLIEEVKNEQAE